MTTAMVPFDGGVQIKTRYSPFDRFNAKAHVIPFMNQSIADLAELLPSSVKFTCSLNGGPVPESEWALTFVNPGCSVLFIPMLHGGGGGKNPIVGILMIVAAIVISIYAPQAGLAMAAAEGGSVATAIVAAQYAGYVAFALAVSGAAILMTSLLPTIAPPSAEATPSSITSWSPQTTQKQGGAIQKYYGRHKVTGNVIGSRIENVSDKQYLFALISLGYGPVYHISDFFINDVAANLLHHTHIIATNGYLTQPSLPGFDDTSVDYPISRKLLYDEPFLMQTTGNTFDKLIIRLLFPQGLGFMNMAGGLEQAFVAVEVKVKRTVDTEWVTLNSSNSSYATNKTFGFEWMIKYDGDKDPTPLPGNPNRYNRYKYTEGKRELTTHYRLEPGSNENGGDAWVFDGFIYYTWTWTDYYSKTYAPSPYNTYNAASRNRIPVDLEYEVPIKGEYEILLIRKTIDRDTDPQYLDVVYTIGYAEIEYDEFTYPRRALVAVRALATDQISGSFKFSCILDGAIVRVYRSEAWHIEWSDNPAWICYDILTSPVFKDDLTQVLRYDGYDPSRVVLAGFIEWATFCDTLVSEGHTQSLVLGTDGKKYECIKTHVATDRSKSITGIYTNQIPAMYAANLPSGLLTEKETINMIAVTKDVIGITGYVFGEYDVPIFGVTGTITEYVPVYAFPGHEPFRACNGTGIGEYWETRLEGNPAESNICYEFVSDICIGNYELQWIPGYHATSWVFEGWDDPSWVAIDTVTGATDDGTGAIHLYETDNPVSYKKYRIRLTGANDAGLHVKMAKYGLLQSGTDYADFWQEITTNNAATTWTRGTRYHYGQEKRYTFNGGFDNRSSRWESALQVCSVAQATLVRVGSKIMAFVDCAKTPTQLFSEGNLTSFSEKFLDLANRATEIQAQFKNVDNDYETDIISVFQGNAASSYGSISLQTFGLVHPSEVWRIAKHRVIQNQRARTLDIGVDIDAIDCMVSDVVYVQSEASDWGNSRGGNVLSGTTNTITVDKEITIENGKSYGILIHISGVILPIEKALLMASHPPGTYSILTINGTWGVDENNDPLIPAFGDWYAFGETNKVAKQFSVLNITPNENHGAQISLIEYRPEWYALVDSMEPEIKLTPATSSVKYVVINDVTLCEVTYFDKSGVCVRTIHVKWTTPSSGPEYAHAKVYYRKFDPNGSTYPTSWVLAGTTTGHDLTIAPVDHDTSYEVRVMGVDILGIAPVITDLEDYTEFVTTAGTPTAAMIPLPSVVTGLQIKDNAVNGNFTGCNCTVIWTAQDPLGANLANGGSIGGAPILYAVTVKTNGGTTLRSLTTLNAQFTYTLAENILDSAGATFTIYVRAKDAWGRLSANAVSIVAVNTAPSAIAGLAALSIVGGAKFTWTRSTDPDLQCYQISTKIGGGDYGSLIQITDNTFSRVLTAAEVETYGSDVMVYLNVKAIDAYGQTSTLANASAKANIASDGIFRLVGTTDGTGDPAGIFDGQYASGGVTI